uniref:Immunoglobulin V-set domain-containing protein n=1 Tax=Gouania willdenowi TaxID=441366 RepID=A0A8C5GP58_GOUWI
MSSDWLLGGFTAFCSSTRGQHCAIATPLCSASVWIRSAALKRAILLLNMNRNVILTQGQTATLNCTFTTTDSTPYLFWYKLEVNSYPKFILRRSRSSADNSPEFVKDRFDAELKDSSVPLMIQDLHVCDSAVYYSTTHSSEKSELFDIKQLFF